MSANAPLSEGTAAPATAPDSGLGVNADQTAGNLAPAATVGEIWERNFAEKPAPAEATPTPEASPESAAPTVEAIQPTPDPDADKFDKIDPNNAKAQDFQELRGRKKELERTLKLVEPLAQKAQTLGDPQVIDILAPLFQTFESDDDPAVYEAGKNVAQGLHGYDQRVSNGLAAGVYELYKPWMLQEALAEHGITPADLTGFQEWKESGGTAVRTVYAPVGFPEPDREGYVTIDGIDLNVGRADDPTSGDPAHKAAYASLRQNWERDQKEKARDDDFNARETERVNRERQGIVNQRQTKWADAEVQAFAEHVAANPITVEGGMEQDQKTAERLTSGVLRDLIEEDAELQRWQNEGQRLAGQGAAKANALAMNIRQRTQDHYKTARDQVSGLFKELTHLRSVVAGGTVQTAPRLPADTIPAQPGQVYNTPPPPSQAGGNEYQNIFSKNFADLPS